MISNLKFSLGQTPEQSSVNQTAFPFLVDLGGGHYRPRDRTDLVLHSYARCAPRVCGCLREHQSMSTRFLSASHRRSERSLFSCHRRLGNIFSVLPQRQLPFPLRPPPFPEQIPSRSTVVNGETVSPRGNTQAMLEAKVLTLS